MGPNGSPCGRRYGSLYELGASSRASNAPSQSSHSKGRGNFVWFFWARHTLIAVVPQNLIRADGNAGELPGRANAVDFESGKRRRDGYIALFLSRSTRRQRDASLRDRTQRTADGFFDCSG